MIASCATVIVAPEVNKIKVFKNGTSNAFKVSNKYGGQTPPST
jgi:hypothetical protein